MEPKPLFHDQSASGRWQAGDPFADDAARAMARRGNRRRLFVFGLSFIVALLLGQAWNFSRPAEYVASTRLQLTLPEARTPGQTAAAAYATKLQFFNSRPMLEQLAQALAANGTPAADLGPDPAGRLQAMLEVVPVPDSEIVELRASGTQPRLLADMLNAMPGVVQAELAARVSGEAETQLESARDELVRLERSALERRQRLESFRQRAGVQAERDDNDAVAQVKGLQQAWNVAVEKEAAAAARLKAVTQAVEQGSSSTQARADPTLSALEARAHQAREELRELERTYTPDFMAMDPRARALRSRLTELERQIADQRGISQRAVLQSAREEQAGAQAQAEQLRAQLQAARPALARTSSRLVEAKVQEDDLAQIEKARREVLEKLTRLEADEQRRVARIEVVEAAVVPTVPWRPDHWRDAGLVLLVAAVLALALMAVVEAFNRPPAFVAAQPATTLVLAPAHEARRVPLAVGAADPQARLAAAEAAPMALPAPIAILNQAEAAALLVAASGATRLLCTAGLMGLGVGEALELRAADIDRSGRCLKVGGAWARQLPLPHWLPQALPEDGSNGGLLLHDALGQALTASDVGSMLVSVALDAGIDDATALSWDRLRDTCIDWLVGQGLRYSELPKFVGRVDAGLLQALSARHARPSRPEPGRVEFLMPALQLDPEA